MHLRRHADKYDQCRRKGAVIRRYWKEANAGSKAAALKFAAHVAAWIAFSPLKRRRPQEIELKLLAKFLAKLGRLPRGRLKKILPATQEVLQSASHEEVREMF